MADVVVTLTIRDAKVNSFTAGFLRQQPIPEGSGLNAKQWLTEWLKEKAIAEYRNGTANLLKDTLENNIVE